MRSEPFIKLYAGSNYKYSGIPLYGYPLNTDTRYYGQFRLSRGKAHIFFIKLTRLLWTPVNTDNGHFSVSRVINSYNTSLTLLYGHCSSVHVVEIQEEKINFSPRV